MSVPNAVRWVDLDPKKIEDIISVLISRLHPEAQRIDGSGGDGGRDVQVPLTSGLIIYEVKSFTGRLDDSRKSQIKRSLKRAKNHNPKHWHLIMPLDMTPKELDWYNGLKDEYSFVSEFTRGKTWLDSELARRLDIVRYYTGDSNSEIISYLRELRAEEAALSNGVPDAIERVNRLISRLDEVDPHYSFGIHITPNGEVRTEIHPKYPGAELDRPILIKAKFSFPRTPEGEAAAADFMDSLDYGTPAELPGDFVQSIEVDAPAGMGGTWSGGSLKLGSVAEPAPHGVQYSAVVTNPHGRPLASIPLTLTNRFRGDKGAQIEFRDTTGFLSVRSRINVANRTANFTFGFEYRDCVLPSSLLPTLRFLSHFKVDNQWGLAVNDEVTQLQTLSEAFMPDLVEYARYIDILATLQEYTGFSFPVPEELTESDAERLKTAIFLIRGNNLVKTWDRASIVFTREGLENWRTLTGQGSRQILMQEDFYTEICGHQIYVGQVRKHIASARAEMLPELEGSNSGAATFPVTLLPGDDATFTTSLVPRESDEF